MVGAKNKCQYSRQIKDRGDHNIHGDLKTMLMLKVRKIDFNLKWMYDCSTIMK